MLLGLLEHRGDPMVHDDGDRSSASKVKGGIMAYNGWKSRQVEHSGVIGLCCVIDQEGSMVWCRRKKKQVKMPPLKMFTVLPSSSHDIKSLSRCHLHQQL